MKEIYLLDCTLRDGGYINNWDFGAKSIKNILEKTISSGVEYIECGYLSEKSNDDINSTKYKDLDSFNRILPHKNKKNFMCLMIDYGQFSIDRIPLATPDSPVIRVCFHKKDMLGALDFCKRLIDKGYKVFVQPMAANNYSDEEFFNLINLINKLLPSCFYIVDSFGVIESEDFQRILLFVDHNLDSNIILGYHAHNNLQQAYGNAKYMVEHRLDHNIIIDASVYGMGRGAGNLNMELFASYLNRNYDKTYNIDAFLDIMDEYLKPIFAEHFWGYSLPFYLSARYSCHPNYASYFSEKNTLSNKSMKQLLASIPEDYKNHFDVKLAENYYHEFQKKYIDDSKALAKIKKSVNNRNILILAPGRSISDHRDDIYQYIDSKQPVVFAINVSPEYYNCDYLFCSNEKRLRDIDPEKKFQLIVTSNISEDINAIRVNYSSYLGESDLINDNPTLMLLRLLNSIGIDKVEIAGFDGYSASSEANYFDSRLAMGTSIGVKEKKNSLISEEIRQIKKSMTLNFLTNSLYLS